MTHTTGPIYSEPKKQQFRADEEVSLLAVATVFLRYRRLIVLCALTGAFVALAIAALRPTRFKSALSFIPHTTAPSTPSSLAALTGAFGINLGTRELGDTPEFYVELLRSRPVLERVARDTFRVADRRAGGSEFVGTIPDYLGTAAAGPEVRVDRAVEWLKDEAYWVGIRRGIVHVSVSTSSPHLSKEIADRTLVYLGEFNVGRRQARASAERRFIDDRLGVARTELDQSEQQMQEFLRSNRQYQDSPELVFRHERLQRDITMRQQVYTSLVQQREQARIDEVRNTPVVTVIDAASLPVLPEPRRLPFALIAGLVLGGVAATFVAFAFEQVRRKREAQTPDYRGFDSQWQDTKAGAHRIASASKLTRLS